MIMRKRKGSKAATLALSLCIAFTSALSAGAGPLTAYAAEQTLEDDLKDEANSKNENASTQGKGKVQGSESSQTATNADKVNHAILVHLAEGYSLDAVPKQDAESLQKILYNTDQFDESQDSIKLLSIPENDEKNDYKAKIWAEIDKIAKDTDDNSFTVFAYSGHGGALGDGTSSLALGGINNISAAELRQHLNKLSGRVLVILSCCHSGG